MTVSAALRSAVRSRAAFACEFCGVTETDAGGELTVDHLEPVSRGGEDTLDNLVYCCSRCNLYKRDHWPVRPMDPVLWNPRSEPARRHFVELDDRTVHAVSSTGAFTVQRLRLNRPALVAWR